MSDNQGIIGFSQVISLVTVAGTALLAIYAIKAHRLSNSRQWLSPLEIS